MSFIILFYYETNGFRLFQVLLDLGWKLLLDLDCKMAFIQTVLPDQHVPASAATLVPRTFAASNRRVCHIRPLLVCQCLITPAMGASLFIKVASRTAIPTIIAVSI